MYDLSNLRKNYSGKNLMVEDTPLNPYELFAIWLEDALKYELGEANAMILSTVGENMQPHSRVVLLKSFSEQGFVFFTNYKSQKGKDIAINPFVALLFFWQSLQRQVRIHGKAQYITREESETYFNSRPIDNQYAAMASQQSLILPDKKVLINEFERLKQAQTPKCPEYWGGYIVIPYYFEFWQGQPNRLHDRLVYELHNEVWEKYLLYP